MSNYIILSLDLIQPASGNCIKYSGLERDEIPAPVVQREKKLKITRKFNASELAVENFFSQSNWNQQQPDV